MFLLGVVVLFIALASPLDDLADHYLLSAHMVQHMLLTLVVPPLMLLGTPDWLVRPLLRSRPLAALLRVWTRPLPAFVVFNFVFALAHFPVLYNFALENELAHAAEHLVFLATAFGLWWPLLSPLPELPRLPYALQMLYVIAQTIPGALVGAFVTLADSVLYRTYALAPRVTVLAAREDQQLGGLIMWIGQWSIMFVVLGIVFFVWARREQVRPLRT